MTKRLVRTFNFLGAFATAAAMAACTVHTTDTPGLTGPSENVGPITLPTQSPTARFTFAPGSPAANSLVAFDGTMSCPGQVDPASTTPCPSANATLTAFTWDFGDGATATGPVASHSYGTPGSYAARLTVTNSASRSHTTAKSVTVTAGLLPTAAFTFSPTAPKPGTAIVFNASTSTAGVGHSLVGWAWEFGDGTIGSGQIVNGKAYAAAGAYVVTLTVIDESGQTKSVSSTVNVAP